VPGARKFATTGATGRLWNNMSGIIRKLTLLTGCVLIVRKNIFLKQNKYMFCDKPLTSGGCIITTDAGREYQIKPDQN